MLRRSLMAAAWALVMAATALAGVPKLINFQGILKTPSNTPVPDGSYSVTFTIYNAVVGGTNYWSETQSVTTAGGLFAVLLGASNPVPDSVFSNSNRWLGIAVSPDPEMAVRQQLVSVGYSFRVNSVDSASGGTITSKVSIGPGHTNTGTDAFVAGANNIARGDYSVVSGGGGPNPADSNAALGNWSTVGGGVVNAATGPYATVAGGYQNRATGQFATVAGGNANRAALGSSIGGGNGNTAGGGMQGSTIAGGNNQLTTADGAFIGGGVQDTASGQSCVIGGGQFNIASGVMSTIGGGGFNKARGQYSVVAGGGGSFYTDSNLALGDWSMVPGGRRNTAGDVYSFAAGRRAKANHAGSFVWADSNDADFASNAIDEFDVRASGGTRIYSNAGLTAGVTLAAGASAWVSVSDSTLKRNIRTVSGKDILAKVMKLPIKQWSYKSQDAGIEHIGPMAQDFYPLFKVGDNDKTISTIDPPAIALAAIQELYRLVQEQRAANEALQAQNDELSLEMQELRELVQEVVDGDEAPAPTAMINSQAVSRK